MRRRVAVASEGDALKRRTTHASSDIARGRGASTVSIACVRRVVRGRGRGDDDGDDGRGVFDDDDES